MPRESKASRSARAGEIVAALARAYPQSTCALRHDSPFQLLISTALSAQTTDVKVNEATATLFARYPTPEKMAQASEEQVGSVINGIGLWRNKARNAVGAAKLLVAWGYGDGADLPRTIDELIRLPGVGRKTATAVLGTAFNLPAGMTVDTHMLRINRLLRLSRSERPDVMASDLEAIIDASEWSRYTHRIIDHGRLVCVARRPRCGVCPLEALCPSARDPAAGYRPRNDDSEPATATRLSWLA